ncbi:MAG: hypothetical protein AAF682_08285 [Planctomycetota bacterium]
MKQANTSPLGTTSLTSLFLLALSWIFLVPVYDRPIPWVGWLLILSATALVVAATPSAERAKSAAQTGWRGSVLPVAAALGLLLPMPFRLGFALLGVGLVAARLDDPRLRRLGALVGLGTAFLLQSVAFVGYQLVASSMSTFQLGHLLAPVLGGLFGIDTLAADGQLFVGDAKLQLVAVTLDSLGVLIPLLVAVPLWLRASREGSPTRIYLLLFAYAVVRYAAVVAWAAQNPEHYPYLLTPVTIALTYVPLVALLWTRPVREREPWLASTSLELRPGLYAVGALAAACTAYGLIGVDRGTDKAGRILVDDAHGAWESGTAERSMDDFGTDSTYTYSALWDWLGGYYPTRIKSEGRLTAAELDQTDILVLKTPSFAYTAEERKLIERFVARGGGLFAIGDHTDVFGTTTVLNAALDPFGLEIEKNVGLLIRKRYVGDYRYYKDRFFPNPLTHRIASAFDFMGAAGVRVTEGTADHVMLCHAQVLEGADYRDSSFFGDRIIDLDDEVRPFNACVSKRYGDGRVAVWGDSTVFSNFSMFESGKPEVILSIVSYLNKRNAQPIGWKPGLRLLGLLLAGGGLAFLAFRRSGAGLVSALSGCAAGLLLIAIHGRTVQEGAYAEPEFNEDLTVVGFDFKNGRMDVDVPPGDGLATEQESRTGGYESLFQATMRLPDTFPRTVTDYDDLDELDVLFLVDPKPMSAADDAALARAVDDGLKLVVVESARGESQGSVDVLERHGIRFRAFADTTLEVREVERMPRQIAAVDSGLLAPVDAAFYIVDWEKEFRGGPRSVGYGATILGVSGGIMHWSAGESSVPILSGTPVGHGQIYAFAGGDLFHSDTMGGSSNIILPFDPQMTSYRTFDSLMKYVVGGGASGPGSLAAGHGGHGGHQHDEDCNHESDEHGGGHAGHSHDDGHGHGELAHGDRERDDHGGEEPAHEADGHDDHAHEGHGHEDHGHEEPAAIAPREAAVASAAPAETLADPDFIGPPPGPTAVRARVSVLLKNASQAAFYGGYALENAEGSYLRLAADNGSGRLSQRSPSATVLLTPDAFGLFPRGAPGALGSRREGRADGGSPLSLPGPWSEVEWTEELVEADPWEFVSRSLRDDSIADLGNDLVQVDEMSGNIPAEDWAPLPEDTRYRVLRTDGVVALGGELVGSAELWIGESTGRPRKLTMSFRLVGDVNMMDWYDIVILHDDYQTHAGFPVELEADLSDENIDWVDLNDGVAFAEARAR